GFGQEGRRPRAQLKVGPVALDIGNSGPGFFEKGQVVSRILTGWRPRTCSCYVSLRWGPPCGGRGEDAGCWLGTGASNSARSMSYPIAEVLGRVERRRRFSVEQKVAVLAEATAPGANMSEVARRHGLLPAQVYKWRRLAELG